MQALTESLDLELPAQPESVAEARHAAARLARHFGAEEADVKIAVSEAVGNAVLHAYRGDAQGTVNVKGSLIRGKLVFVVADNGRRDVAQSRLARASPRHPADRQGRRGHADRRRRRGTSISFSFPVSAEN